jgi:hypothetical protein
MIKIIILIEGYSNSNNNQIINFLINFIKRIINNKVFKIISNKNK